MRILILLCTLIGLGFAQAQQPSPIITNLTSAHLVEGEVAYFNLIYRDENPEQAPPNSIQIGNHTISQRGFTSQNINGSRFYIYQYPITDLPVGNYTIPSLDLPIKGQTVKTPSADIEVVSLDTFKVEKFDYKGSIIQCYSKVFGVKPSCFPGEATELTYKVCIPAQLNPQQFGLPKAQTVSNCTAWRFSNPQRNREINTAYINNERYIIANFSTVLTALKPGAANYGPLSCDLIIAPSSVNSRFGFSRLQTAELPITSTPIAINVRPFPTAEPENFKGAVGQLTLESELPDKSSISLNDSITATVTISGTGNLPDIEAPELEDSADWKVVDVSRVQQGDERKELTGDVQFTYILQPQRGATTLPRFTFCHFDPIAEEFVTNTTLSSPITITEPATTGSTILPAASAPQESMKDILGPLSEIQLEPAAPSSLATLPIWLWQIIPATLLLAMLFTAARNKRAANKHKNTLSNAQTEALKKLQHCSDQEFLKEAGSYVERWLSDRPEAQTVLSQRDAECYKPSNEQRVNATQRKELLNLLKSLSLVMLACTLIFGQRASAKDNYETSFQAWQNGDYQAALDGYQSASQQHPRSADLLFNTANCYYRLQQPGMAALYYSKALQLAPQHYESSKNLALIQKSEGSILPAENSQLLQAIETLPAAAYLQTLWLGIWMLALSLLALTIFQLRKSRFVSAILLSVLGFTLCALSTYAYWQHPQRNLTQLGAPGIITTFSPVMTEPIHATGKDLEQKTMIKATPASPCRILAERADWAYIQLANGTRGWIPLNALGKI